MNTNTSAYYEFHCCLDLTLIVNFGDSGYAATKGSITKLTKQGVATTTKTLHVVILKHV